MTNNKAMERKRSFDPVVDGSTRLLILGSLPGDMSLRAAQYYGNPRNAFWRLMSQVLCTDLVQLDYEHRLVKLLKHGIGLWDVVAEALRAGSLDGSIRGHQSNDLVTLLAGFPSIEAIAFNGRTAAKLGYRQLGAVSSNLRIIELPSSSPAHAVPFEEKFKSWVALRGSSKNSWPQLGDLLANSTR